MFRDKASGVVTWHGWPETVLAAVLVKKIHENHKVSPRQLVAENLPAKRLSSTQQKRPIVSSIPGPAIPRLPQWNSVEELVLSSSEKRQISSTEHPNSAPPPPPLCRCKVERAASCHVTSGVSKRDPVSPSAGLKRKQYEKTAVLSCFRFQGFQGFKAFICHTSRV